MVIKGDGKINATSRGRASSWAVWGNGCFRSRRGAGSDGGAGMSGWCQRNGRRLVRAFQVESKSCGKRRGRGGHHRRKRKRTFKLTSKCGGYRSLLTTLEQGFQLEAPEMIPC